MKLVSYLKDQQDQLALLVDGILYDADLLHPELPRSMGMFLQFWEECYPLAQAVEQGLKEGITPSTTGLAIQDADLLCPVPFPPSLRDGYSFRQHVEAVRRLRGASVPDEFNEFPVFYFSNPHHVQGPGPVRCMPDHFLKLDFELEVAVAIAKPGRNLRAEQADGHIAGLLIFNDFSARQLQAEEMALGLGPAKGKDFASALGPWLVTLDELQDREVAPPPGHVGLSWDLAMSASINGVQVCQGNLRNMSWTFAELIERASYGCDLYAGDLLGSGTVGGGCFLEINQQPERTPQWLQPGDEVSLSVEGLGTLHNFLEAEDQEESYSLLARKKSTRDPS